MPALKKIGLFGGTFDPVHLGHLIIAESVLDELNLDKIYFIPAHKHALKPNYKISAANVRVQMLNLAIKDFPYFEVSDIELQSDNTSFTIDTLKRIKDYEKLGDAELYYIIGYDNLGELHLWKEYEKILCLAKLVVVGRSGNFNTDLIKEHKHKLIFPKTPQIDISSTKIRDNIKSNKPWKSLVLREVNQFIHNQNLYK